MARQKVDLAGKIEKLIVDGNKALSDKIDNLDMRLTGRMDKLEGKMDGLEGRADKIDKKINAVHVSLKNEIKTTAYALDSKIEDTGAEIKKKLDEHIRQPAHI